MRTCQSCGKENPPDQDFCSCGEYLRWEPTGFVQAITSEMAAEAAAQAAPPKTPDAAPAEPTSPPVSRTPPVPPEPGNGNGHHAAPAPPERPAPPPPTAASLPAIVPPTQPPVGPQPPNKTLVRNPAVPSSAPAVQDANESASIVLRLPEGEATKGEALHQAVEPGQRERVLALIRNQSGIVDNYDIRVEGLPEEW